MKRLAFILLCLLFFCIQAEGQNSRFKRADKLYRQHDYGKAIEWYEFLLKNEKKQFSSQALDNLTDCYFATRQYKKAESWLARLSKNEDVSTRALFRYGHVLLINGKPEMAREVFAQLGEQGFVEMVDLVIAGKTDSTEWQTTRMKFNSRQTDFGPAWYGKGLIFCSERPNSVVGVVHKSKATASPLLNIYYSEPRNEQARETGEGKWTNPHPISGNINSKLHEGPATLHPDSMHLFVNRSRKIKKSSRRDKKAGPLVEILVFEKKKNNWKSPKKAQLPDVNVSYLHPSPSPDGKWLYFASDLPGGQGGLDIYRVRIDGDHWGKPQNLGPAINTPHNEVFPYQHKDGTLYFASNGHSGYGGLDLFEARPAAVGWTPPRNLGEPINSRWDDFSLIMNRKKTSCYFASNRGRNSKADNIYHASRELPDFENCPEQEEPSLCYKFYEKGMEEDLPFQLIYEWDFGDGNSAPGVRARHCYEKPGDYTITLKVIDSLSGGHMFNQATYHLNIQPLEQPYIDVSLDRDNALWVGVNAEKSNIPGFVTEGYFWDFGDGNIGAGPETSHLYTLPGDYTVRLGLSGHLETESGTSRHCVTRTVEIATSGDLFGVGSLINPKEEKKDLYASTESPRPALTPPNTNTSRASKSEATSHPNPNTFIGPVLHQPESIVLNGQVFMPGEQIREGKIVWKDQSSGEVVRETHGIYQDGTFITQLPTGVLFNCEIRFEGYRPYLFDLDLRDYSGTEKIKQEFHLIPAAE